MVRRTAGGSGVVLSHLEFDLLWEDLDTGEPPYPISVASHGATVDERDALAEQVYAGLEQDEQLDDDVDELLNRLVRPEFSVDVQLMADESLQVLAATRGGPAAPGVFAVLSEAELVLEPLPGNGLLPAVAGLLGELAPGPGAPVSMPRSAYSAAMGGFVRNGYGGFEAALAAAGVTGSAVRAVATLVESRRTAAGQLAANGPGGRRSPVLNLFDTEAGRYLVTLSGGTEQWVTVEPADQRRIMQRLTELLEDVTSV
ncbi:ESX secretion-associated protein EspG [Amycolatopsis nigrescens]|uniref:ESX secretion-associated protein EspG n=1 Tax=Amycolatopsis nigrescens TaxID=381445 RepID=UPI000366D06A|nr:ESX secretion-associated protein EspG [Amycolatopsis nigrescens]